MGMTCPKCGSTNVSAQAVSESQLSDRHHGVIWWLLVGWWWILIKWLCFFLPALIIKIFAPKKQKLRTVHKSMFICQNCGNMWEAK